MSVELASIRHCLDGAVPAAIATVSSAGVPNVSFVSEVHYVDTRHVALSYQFFNKTRENVTANGRAQALVIDPYTGTQYELELGYLRTETAGPVFESMRVKLAGIAAHTGMSGVFRLLGADIYEVDIVTRVGGDDGQAVSTPTLLPQLRSISQLLVASANLDALLDAFLEGLGTQFGVKHAMLFLVGTANERLYLIASSGYPESGIGSEVPLGYGMVGIAGAERTPIRITHMAEEFRYSDAIRKHILDTGNPLCLETAIPLPGLERPASQLAVPVMAADRLLGVLYVESERDGAFGYDMEDVLVTLANQFASSLHFLDDRRITESPDARHVDVKAGRKPMRIRCISDTSSIFIDDDYLIKGVAGAIFWKLVRDYEASGRTEFSNRELRADPEIRLPEFSENLEARLVLLKRRLNEQSRDIRIEPVARGRFRLDVRRPVRLETVGGAGTRADAA
jgi:adenylate cyclase